MLKTVPNYNNNDLLEYAYQICRWHHERYDGHGYPCLLYTSPVWVNCRGDVILDEFNKPLYLIGCVNEIGKRHDAGDCGLSRI